MWGLAAALRGIWSGTRYLEWGTAQQGPYVQGRPPTLPITPTWCNKVSSNKSVLGRRELKADGQVGA